MKKCKRCGNVYNDANRFCDKCGSNENVFVCNSCQTVFDTGFCPACGVKAGDTGKICLNCKTTYFSSFCPECGSNEILEEDDDPRSAFDAASPGPAVNRAHSAVPPVFPYNNGPAAQPAPQAAYNNMAQPVQPAPQAAYNNMDHPVQPAPQVAYNNMVQPVQPMPQVAYNNMGQPVQPVPQVAYNNMGQPVQLAPQIAYNTAAAQGKPKNKWVAFFLCLFLGFFGAHMFYEGKIKMGFVWFFTFGFFGIGWLVYLFIYLFKPNPYYV